MQSNVVISKCTVLEVSTAFRGMGMPWKMKALKEFSGFKDVRNWSIRKNSFFMFF